MKATETWILVCDASRARIFSLTDWDKPWKLAHELDRPEARAKTSDLVTDGVGRVQQSGNTSLKPGMESPTDPKEVEAMRFAQEIAELLSKGRTRGDFGELVVAAAPHFLGLLRKKISDPVARLVQRSIDKDYTHLSARELATRLRAP